MRLFGVAILVAISTTMITAAAVPNANAVACADEWGVFWNQRDTNGNSFQAAGAFAEMTENHPPLPSCVYGTNPPVFGYGHTTRVLIGGTFGHYAEVGWGNQYCVGTSAYCPRAFFEYRISGGTLFVHRYQFGA